MLKRAYIFFFIIKLMKIIRFIFYFTLFLESNDQIVLVIFKNSFLFLKAFFVFKNIFFKSHDEIGYKLSKKIFKKTILM